MTAPKESWTILEMLRWASDYFRTKEVSEPRASAEVLLAHALGSSRLDLYLRYDQPLDPEELARFKALVVRRRAGEPVAYLTGHREFWSLDFLMTPAVLIPRPETETLVAATLEVVRGHEELARGGEGPPARVLRSFPLWGLEVGVGSGAVVVTLAKELPQVSWVGIDLSLEALLVAQENARRHEVAGRIHFFQADLFAALRPQASFDLLVANLPYVPRSEWQRLPREIREFEPQTALLGGEDGLSLMRPLARQAHQYVRGGGWVLLEVGDRQASQIAAVLQGTEAYDRAETEQDFSGVERVVRARRRMNAL